MNYELGNKLRAVGYEGYLHFEGDGTVTCDLAELIEACGKDFGGLTRSPGGDMSFPTWGVYAAYDPLISSWNCETPKQAVAEFLLSLNPKTK